MEMSVILGQMESCATAKKDGEASIAMVRLAIFDFCYY
jgi:hypothetical protein